MKIINARLAVGIGGACMSAFLHNWAALLWALAYCAVTLETMYLKDSE